MALSFLNLQTKVFAWLGEDTAEDFDPELLVLVKEALIEADVERSGIDYKWKFMISTSTLPIISGTRTYTLPATFHTPVFFWSQAHKLYLTEFPDYEIPTRDTSGAVIDDMFVTSPVFGGFVIRNQTLTLLWTPTEDDTWDYEYYHLPVEMSADGDFPNIPYPHSRMLIYDALLRMETFNETIDAGKVNYWERQLQRHEDGLLESHGQENSQNAQSSYID